MSTADQIRKMLAAGASTEEIVAATGARSHYVRQIRYRARNPEYHRTWMRRWRECNPGYEKRRSIQRLIKGIQVSRAAEAQRVQKVMGPAHWYG